MNSSIEQLKLYTIDDAFIKDLHDNIDSRVFNNNDPAYNHARKYLGVLIKIGSFSYYAPLSSPKDSDYIIINGIRSIRNSIMPIIRMTESKADGKRHLLGTIKLGNMIPVPDNMLQIYDLDNEPDPLYKDLVLKEKRFINRNEELITSYAYSLYNEKNKGTSKKGFVTNAFDYKKFEQYVSEHYLNQNNHID